MLVMCWACTERYEDSLVICPFCGVPKDKPATETEAKKPIPKKKK